MKNQLKMIKEKNHLFKQEDKPISILCLVTTIGETTSAYNELSLPLKDKYNITFCTYFKATVSPAPEITLFEGDGSLMGFFRNFHSALNAKEYQIIHVHMAAIGFLFLVANIFYRKSMDYTVYTVHNSYQNFKLRNKLILIPIFATFKTVICCSQASLESLPHFLKNLAGNRLFAVANGVNIDRVDLIIKDEHKSDYHNELFTLVTIGRLIEIKNPIAVLNAFKKSDIQKSRLVFVGQGDLHELLVRKTKELDIEKQIEFTGLIPRDEVYKMLVKADLFISASWGEGLPVATLEAMACGCPVLLSDIAPHREIAEGVDFIPLIQPDDVAGFGREIKRFQEMSVSQRTDIGKKCRQLVEDKFSLNAMNKGYEAIYKQIIS